MASSLFNILKWGGLNREAAKAIVAMDTRLTAAEAPKLGFNPTTATAGTPGAFTPTGATVPANLAALQLLNPVASPLTLWTTGQRVALGTGTAHWNATAWVTGNAP